MIPLIYAATGHRPNKLGGFKPETDAKLVRLAASFLTKRKEYIDHVISGMAIGWDMAWAEAALSLGIPVHAAIPCKGQENMWPTRSRDRYTAILSGCRQKIIIHYNDTCMQDRNKWMVNHCDKMVALFDGTPGGTSNCVDYAESRNKKIINLWDTWSAM
jgi:uncharacterized phage-like protein YoqJ